MDERLSRCSWACRTARACPPGAANGQTWAQDLVKADNWKSTINTPNNQYFANPEVVTRPDQYAIGTSPRALSNIRWPGTNNMSASLFKQFRLDGVREGTFVEVRLETFNTLNHVQFCGPDSTYGSGSFGQVTSQCNGARQLQLGGKFYF